MKCYYFSFLIKNKERLITLFQENGISQTRDYIFHQFGIKMRRADIRRILGLKKSQKKRLAAEAHQVAWSSAGWKGNNMFLLIMIVNGGLIMCVHSLS